MGLQRTEEELEELQAAEHNYRGCEGHLQRSVQKWGLAQAAASSNKLHYRLRRTYGDDYRQKLKDAYESALQGFADARVRLEKATRAREEAIAAIRDEPECRG